LRQSTILFPSAQQVNAVTVSFAAPKNMMAEVPDTGLKTYNMAKHNKKSTGLSKDRDNLNPAEFGP